MVKDYVIIGAGISGLVLALELLKKNKKVTILEKSSSVGGLAKSISYDDYVVDFGPHLFHSAHPEIIQYWRDFVGDELISKDFYSGNYSNGKIYDYPINRETAKEQYTKQEFDLISKQLSNLDNNVITNASSYHDYVRELAGNFLADKFFTHYPKKLWGIDTKNLSARFAPRRIEIREKRLPFHSGPGRFAGIIEGGCGTLSEKIKDQIIKLGGKINFNVDITQLISDSRNNITTLIDSNSVEFPTNKSCVISTMPINALCNKLGYDTKLYFRNILLVNIIIKGDDPFPDQYDWLYFDDENIPFHRVGVQTRFSRKNISSGIHILCCEIAFNPGEVIDKASVEEDCIVSLQDFNLLNRDTIINIHTYDIGPVYPGYFIGHELELNRVNGQLGKHRNLYHVGSLAEYSYSDQQVLTAKSIDLARELETLSSGSHSEIVKFNAISHPAKEFTFGRGVISSNRQIPVFTIAEIGLCHNGDVALCKNLILEAKNSGFSAAKIQTYIPGRISKKSRTSRYFEETLDQEESLSDQIDKIIFSLAELEEVFKYAKSIDFDLFSTPFDFESAEILNTLNVPGFKISSMDLVNIPLIKKVASFSKPIILSTGMASIGEIEEAINAVLAEGNAEIAVLHCVSSYPCPIEDSNLGRINLIHQTFGVVAGYSDHTTEYYTPAFSLAMGARVIEKHITLDKGFDGPDHHFSLIPSEMTLMMDLVLNIQQAINGNNFRASDIELIAKSNLRRSLYAKGDIDRGDIVNLQNISIKSPGDGIPVKYLHLILNKRIIKSVKDDEPIDWSNFFND